MKFPELPDDLSIGDRTLQGKRRAVFKGTISSDSPTEIGIPSGNVKITVHDRGIRLKNVNNKAVMDIHNAQLVSLNIETQDKSYQKNPNGILKTIYKILALITLGAMVRDLAEEPSKYSKEVSYLVIHFWNTSLVSAQKIFICSRKKQVERFIGLFD